MKSNLTVRALLVMSIATAACGDSEGSSAAHRSPNDGGSEQTGMSTDGDAAAASAVEGVWKATSVRLELASFAYETGSFGYDITRERLSAQQLEILARLREIPRPSGPLWADLASYNVRVTDQSGEVTVYRATEHDGRDSDENASDGIRTLEFATLAPFLATFDCLSAKQGGTTGEAQVADPRWAFAGTFNSDASCIHGVFVSVGASHSYRKWRIDAPATYHLSVSRCFQDMRLHLYDATGTNELAVTEFSSAPACPELLYGFDAAGTYLVDLEKRISAGALQDTAGDAQLRVSRQ